MKTVQTVTWSKHGSIAAVTIDNPPVNVLDADVIGQLNDAVDEIEQDRDVKVMILTGAGEKAFVSGGDIKSFPDWMGKGPELAKQKSLWLQKPMNKIERLSKPTIAAINGVALGGGCELALSCDIRIAEEHIKIGLPEIKLGLFPGAGGTQRLPRLVGTALAKEMIFTGEPLSAHHAAHIGLVNRVVPTGKAYDAAMELAEKISSYSMPALSLAKRSVDDGLQQPLTDGLIVEAENFGEVFQTEDIKEGVSAFIEKRTASFLDR
ncbi:enoyl-CoA hydratase/isomerase family protein [Bacillus marinisedimentorum]|uniref:enoyl-CoA hydratase/isomerase family protein n=1 Tax=Bacillus marinisedimentorum TaxID=1821260 RepID=UPI0007DFCB76|nr:enoyl-CoA hydratase [Bacillus marinisedimentorum]